MATFEPMINLLILLTVLSVVAERIANLVKLRSPHLSGDSGILSDKEREHGITVAAVLAGVGVAVLLKADLFEILRHLDAPWETLGWVRVSGSRWVRSAAAGDPGTALYAAGGSAVTGIALGFGSKFWHDVLDIVYEVRRATKRLRAGDAGLPESG